MTNPKDKEKREHEDRKKRFMDAFNNAADVLDNYRQSSYFTNFPNNERGWELRSQFFMAKALGDNHTKVSRLFGKIENYLTPNNRRFFNHAYMTNDYTLGHFIKKLTPATPNN